MVICIIIYHPYIYLLFRLPLLLQRLQVILFYFIISHITLHVFLVTPHDTLFMIISVSTCFLLGFLLYISLLLLVLLFIIPTSCTRILLVICYSIIIGSVCHFDMHFRFDYSFMIAYYMYYCHVYGIISCYSQLHYIVLCSSAILYYYHLLRCQCIILVPTLVLSFITTLHLVPFIILVSNYNCIVISFITIV